MPKPRRNSRPKALTLATILRRAGYPVVMEKKQPPAPLAIQLDAPADATARRFEVTIEGWHPTTLNKLLDTNPGGRSRLKKADALLVAGELKKAGVTAAVGRRRLTYTIIYGPGQRRCDSDAHDKSLRDALKRCGALKEDSPKWLDCEKPIQARAGRHATRIILEDI